MIRQDLGHTNSESITGRTQRLADPADLTSLTWQDAVDKLPEVKTWDDWGEIFLDVPTWRPLVEEICRRAGLPCHGIAAGYPGSNAVFIVNRKRPLQRAAVKIYAPFCHEDYAFEREIHVLLERTPELGAPRLMAHGVLESSSVWPYVVLSFVPGEPIRDVRDDINDRSLLGIAEELGRRLRHLHAIPLSTLSALDVTRAGWRRYTQQQIARTTAALSRETALPDRVINRVPEFVNTVLVEQGTPELVLVSGDVTEDHVMLQRHGEAWAISGLLDFADARVAPREYEWVALWFSALDRDLSSLESFMRGYDPTQTLDQAFLRQGMAYTFLHEFGALIIAEVVPPRMARKIESIRDLQAELWLLT